MRFGIGAKFLTLLSLTLVAVVGTTVWVAVRLFERDQLAMVYVTAELLTANKASEIGTWLSAHLKQAESRTPNSDWLFLSDAGQTAPWSKIRPICEGSPDIWRVKRKSSSAGWVLVAQRKDLCVGIGIDALLRKLSGAEPYEVSILSPEGTILAHSDPSALTHLDRVKSPLADSKVDRQLAEVTEDSRTFISALARSPSGHVIVRTRIDKTIALETIQLVIERSAWLAVLFLSLAYMLAYGVAQGIVAPLRKLGEAAEALASGDYSVRSSIDTHDETRDLAETFNHMSNEIERRIEGLSQLHTTAQKISTKLETPSLLRTSIDSLRGLLGTKNALGFYRGPSSKGPVLDQDNWQAEDRPKLRSLLGKLQKIPMGESPSVVEHEGTPYLVAPIREQANPSGFVLFSGNEKGSFDNEDIHMTGAVMSSVGTSFENIRLLRETADKARIEKELETAKHVQNTMFPPESLTFGPTQIESFYEPAAECGGDWWGALSLPGSRLVIAIGDATGHGVPSALLTASARATFSVLEAIVRRDSPKAASPALILQLLNRAVRDSAKGKILMTMFVATLNTETGEVIVANASHDPVYRLNGEGELNVVECTPGLRLGEETDLLVDETTLQMEAGETLVLYTDGLPEGLNGIDEEYSDRKFQRSIKKHRGLDLASMRDKVIEDFRNFTGDRKFTDDVTLVLARFNPKNSAT